MRLQFIIYFLLIIPSILLGSNVTDYQNTPVEVKDFDESKWEELTKELNYDSKKKKDKDKDDSDWDGPDFDLPSFGSGFFKILLILGVIIVIIVLIIQFAGGESLFKPRSKKIDSDILIDIGAIEENLPEAEIKSHIDTAIDAGNYNLAVRLYYLDAIKSLSNKGLVKWKRNKTNRAYINEISDIKIKTPFRDSTRVFERVWYGDTELSYQQFKVIEASFKDTINNIDQYE